MLVRKKDGSLRCCVDYWVSNDNTLEYLFPAPQINNTFDALVGAKWFSTLDVKSGYHHIDKMTKQDK